MEIRGLKKNAAYNFRIIATNAVGHSEPFIIEETVSTAQKAKPKSLPGKPSVQVRRGGEGHLTLLDVIIVLGDGRDEPQRHTAVESAV